jgi:hypothetical protein
MVGVAGLTFGYASLLSLKLHLLRPAGLSNPVLILQFVNMEKENGRAFQPKNKLHYFL